MIARDRFPKIDMPLYETNISLLQKFAADEKQRDGFTDDYLILYDFAVDCQYAKYIQPDLIRYLLPFYRISLEQALFCNDQTAEKIYLEFNSAIFSNRDSFKEALGEEKYQAVMDYFVEKAIQMVELHSNDIMKWIPFYNTVVSFDADNLRRILYRIFNGTTKVKYSYFQYLSILLFKESDNLLIDKENKAFWTNGIWDFEVGDFDKKFYWNNDIVEIFNREIDKERIEMLFQEIKALLMDSYGEEFAELICEEMRKSLLNGIFSSRKREFLEKINCLKDKDRYWDAVF